LSWRDYIKEALCYDVEHFTIEDIESGIASGDYQLWEAENSALVTSGVKLQGGGVGVQVLAAGGNLDEIMGLLDDVEQEARASGCEVLTTVGRKGWIKTAKELGWLDIASIYIKRLN
jgi:hypothetical protein